MCVISLAMTTYNGERYIEQQLESIKNQKRKVDEVVICDDGSSDKTTDIIRKFIVDNKLKNWNLYINEKNKGFAENFKQAIKYTTGDIVFLSDQDDEWKSDKVERMLNILQNNSNIKLLSCSLEFIDQDSVPFRPDNLPNWYKTMNRKIENELFEVDFLNECTTNFSPGCTMCFKREIADKYISSSYQYPIHHDWLLGLLASADEGFYFLNTALINYRIHRNNAIGITRAGKSKTVEEQLDRLRKLKARYLLGLGKKYKDQTALSYNLEYINCRISFYENRTIYNLIRVWKTSKKIKNIYDKRFMANIKDTLYFFHLIF